MKGILSLAKSRKFWITALGIVASLVGKQFLSAEQVYLIAGLCAVLVASIAGEDIAAKKYLKVDLPEDKQV